MALPQLLKPSSPLPSALPFYFSRISAGTPFPAEPYEDETIDLNQHLRINSSHTFVMLVNDNDMQAYGITKGALLIADRQLRPRHGKIVAGYLEGELVARKLIVKDRKISLISEKPKGLFGRLAEEKEITILGVVTAIIHSL